MKSSSNRLAFETSPYLLQHANNPVNWFSWGIEAFNLAKTENKLVLISIGYSSCHWCHVMEHEAFSDPEVTSFMNSHFINIKVDREERPDVDQIYMNAIQIINRTGGWPLNCFALPDGKPVFGGTYFTPENWLSILKNLNNAWNSNPDRLHGVAEELSQSIRGTEVIKSKKNLKITGTSSIQEYPNKLKKLFDTKNGGIKGSPKFPMPGLLDYLLTYSYHSNDTEILDFVYLTLDKMAMGGIYDHLGGGFSRYSVDENWHIPHFEKMLYDNAQLISLYSLAYRLNPKELYNSVVKESVGFVLNELNSPNGGFIASHDADSEGKEGAYYTWTKQELEHILGEDAELFSVAYCVTPNGNFNETNVLHQCSTIKDLENIFQLEGSTINHKLSIAKQQLLEVRKRRVKPGIDDKVITSWNGLLISALAEAYITFDNLTYLNAAIECIKYIENKHLIDGHLKRILCKGVISVDALLDDYANLVRAYITLYKATLNGDWIKSASELVNTAIKTFFDIDSGMFFYSPSNQTELIVRKMDLTDGVISSSGSVMAQNLFDLGEILNKQDFKTMSTQMLANISDSLDFGGPYLFGWAKLMLVHNLPIANLIINSEEDIKLVNIIQRGIVFPKVYPSFSENNSSENNPHQVKICIGKTCYPSANETSYHIGLINSIKV